MQYLRNAFGAALIAACTFANPAAAGLFDTASVSSPKRLSSYESVYIAPVGVALDLRVKRLDRYGDSDRPVDDNDATAKAADFHGDLVSAFSKSFSIAAAAGDGILTIETTLTNLESSRPTMADYRRDVALSGSSVYAGGGAMTVSFSEAGAPLGQVSDRYNGYLVDGRSRAGIWQDADRAFSVWANKLVKFVQSN